MTSDGIFFVIPTHLQHSIALWGHIGRTRCLEVSPFCGVGLLRCYHQPGRPPCTLIEVAQPWQVPAGNPLIAPLLGPTLRNSFLLYRTFSPPQIVSDRNSKGEMPGHRIQCSMFSEMVLSHTLHFAVYICKPHLFTCPVFVKV